MSIVAFCVNKKQKNFFSKLKDKCNLQIVSSKSLYFSFKAIKYLKTVDFSKSIELRVNEFYAKNKKAPRFLVKFYYIFMAYFYFFKFFKLHKFDTFFIWNGFFLRQAVVIEIAKLFNKEVVYFETAPLPNRIQVDKKGINYLNSVPRNKEFYLNYKNPNPLPKELIPRNPKNVKKFLNAPKKQLPKEFIFVPFQVDYDTQIILFSRWIKSMKELFYSLNEIAKNLKIHIIFKEHPSSKIDYSYLHNECNEYTSFANAYPTQELIEKSKAVITINSSVGVESLLFNKKVITLGDAFYNIDGMVKYAQNKEELVSILENLDNWNLDENLIQNFLKYLYYDYFVKSDLSDIEKVISCK